MPAPTLIQYADTGFTGSGATKATAAITWQAGDIVAAIAGDANSGTNFSTLPTATGLTFSAITGCAQSATGTECATNAWVTSAAAAGGTQAVTFTGTISDDWGGAVWVWRNSGGVGAHAVGVTSALTTSLIRGGANSCVVGAAFDWGANVTTGYGYTPAATDDRQHAQDGTNYTLFVADWGDQGGAGTTSYGVTGFTTTSPFSKVFLEVLASAGGGVVGPVQPPQPGGPAWRRRYRRRQQLQPARVLPGEGWGQPL